MTDSILKAHQAERTNDDLIVAGGRAKKSSELCTLNESGQFTCVDISPLLDNYQFGVSFLVSSDFCV